MVIRVGWFLTDLRGGGAELNPLLLAPALRRSKLSIVLLQNVVEHALPVEAPEIRALSGPGGSLGLRAPLLLARAIHAARDFDVLVGGLEFAPSITAAACGAVLRKPVACFVRIDSTFYEDERVQPGFWRAQREALRRSRAVVVVSEDMRRSLIDWGVPGDKIRVLSNPISPFALEHVANDGPPRLLTVANLKPQKGLDTLLETAALLDRTPFVWHVLGAGRLEGELRRRAAELGLDDRVRFEGFRDPAPYYAAADLFVLTSRMEGFARVVGEAMAAGVATVATRCGADLVERLDGAGVVVPVGDAEALAAAIRELLADPARRRDLGAEGRRRVAALAPSVVAEGYDRLFAELAS